MKPPHVISEQGNTSASTLRNSIRRREKRNCSKHENRVSRGRRLVLILLIYFPLSPVSKFLNCALNSFGSNATRRIKMFENFSHSLAVAAAIIPTSLYVYFLILIILFSSSLPWISSYLGSPLFNTCFIVIIINRIFIKSLYRSLSCKKEFLPFSCLTAVECPVYSDKGRD